MKNKIMSRLKKHLEESLPKEHDWFMICAQGSMNYNLFDSNSDIDSKLLVFPTQRQLVLNEKPTNFVHEMSDNKEHCDIKDIRDYFKIVKKQNINFMEIFFTDFFLFNPKYTKEIVILRNNAELIAASNYYRFIKSCVGMILEKQHALCHPYPSKLELIENYGYDGKQLSHAYRIADFMSRFIKGESYKSCLLVNPREKDFLMKLKRNELNDFSCDKAIEVMEQIVNASKRFEECMLPFFENKIDEGAEKFMDEFLTQIVMKSIREEY